MPEEEEDTEKKASEAESEAKAKAKETEHQAKLDAAEEKARKADEARIRAEAERDAFVKSQEAARTASAQGAQWTEEQWAAFEAENGLTRKQVSVMARMAQQQVDETTRSFDEKVKKAEDRAAKAEERAARIESSRAEQSAKGDFYSTRPALARYSKDVDEFLSRFPESDRSDPDKLKELLPLAETYVRGKVGDKMRIPQGGGSPRFDRGQDTEDSEHTEVDVTGLEEHQARLVRSIVPSKEGEALLKQFHSDSLPGVRISGADEWKEAEADIAKGRGRR